MEDNRFLLETFNNYYGRGKSALEKGDSKVAKRNFCEAAKALYKLADGSEGSLKKEYCDQADKLVVLIKKMEESPTTISGTNPGNVLSAEAKIMGKATKEDGPVDEDLTQFNPIYGGTGDHLSDICGLKEAKQKLYDLVIGPLSHPDVYSKFGQEIGGGILLYGLPGTGKTMFARAVATELKAPMFVVSATDIDSKWHGESAKNMRALFDAASKFPLSVIFFDEMENITPKRTGYATAKKDVLNVMKECMDGFKKRENKILFIGATNHPDQIDTAIARPGRFDTLIYIPLPDKEARTEIIKKCFERGSNGNSIPVGSDFDYNELSTLTEGFTGADIKKLCNLATKPAIERQLGNPSSEEYVTYSDVKEALKDVHSSVDHAELESLMEYEKSHR